MKSRYPAQLKTACTALFCIGLAAQSGLAWADVVDLAKAPLYNSTAGSVKPNLMFILDNSGSMNDDYLPDEADGNTRYGYWSSQCNGVAYNPSITYTVPVDANGNAYVAPSFSSACSNGFSGSVVASGADAGKFKCTGGTDLANKYYYKYTATIPQLAMSYKYTTSGVDTSTTFYKECRSTIGNTPGSGVFTKVTLTSSSSEAQNYANWYSFYRTRMLMMKTASGQAFKSIDNNFRIGFSTISYTGTSSANAGFLAINDFSSGTGSQKEKFYGKLYGASGSSYTPLRGALSKAGRYFSGRLGDDPMQYSCQQNFTLLSTDGYWNTSSESSSYGPFGLDNATPVGEQDGAGNDPPQWDGDISKLTLTTPIVTTTVVTTPKTVVDRFTRTVATNTSTSVRTKTNTYTRTRVTKPTDTCSGTPVTVRTRTYAGSTSQTETTRAISTQTQEQLPSTSSTDTATTTSTVTRTVVTINGVTAPATYSTPAVSTNTTNAINSTTSGVWANSGAPVITNPVTPTAESPAAPSLTNPSTWSGTWALQTDTTACLPASTATYDTAVAGVPTYTPPASGTNLAVSTSSTAHDFPASVPPYPRTTLGTAATVVSGPTEGTTTTSTAGSVPGPHNTLADIAAYYYQTDLRKTEVGGSNTCTSGSSTGANLCPVVDGIYTPNVPGAGDDTNPQPHMTTFTLGLGMDGVLDYLPNYADPGVTTGDFALIKAGSKIWPDPKTSTTSPYGNTGNSVIERIDDLWHAAVNGRGTYFSAKDPTALVSSLTKALAGMTTRLGYGTAAATSNLAPIQGDNSLYVASYTTKQWTGNLVAQSINTSTGAVNSAMAWCVESVAKDEINNIPACTGKLQQQVADNSRTIYFNNAGTLGSFSYANLSATQKAWFDPTKLSQYSTTFSSTLKPSATTSAALAATLVDYLRGQTPTYSEGGVTTNIPYRSRLATLGDIVESQPVFIGKPYNNYYDPGYSTWKSASAQQNRKATVYVGANDGMVHAFDATVQTDADGKVLVDAAGNPLPSGTAGNERWAFVPTPVMPNMYWLADATYEVNHRNYANGRLVYSDVCFKNCDDAANADWHTILMGGLNGGGRGYFALDLTENLADPSKPPKLLWEKTSLDDPDLGYSFGNPLAVKLANNGKWVVLVTSGYDNVTLGNVDPYDAAGTGRGFLYVLDPETGATLKKIDTGVGSTTTPSGLARHAVWADHPDTDVTAKYVYSGDLLGNFWQFVITSATSSGTTTYTGSKSLLATFTDTDGHAQPITTRPEMALVGNERVLFVSTGKYLEAADLEPDDTVTGKFNTQSVYAFVDNGDSLNPRVDLVKQTLTDVVSGTSKYRTVTANTVLIPTNRGWYIDFPDNGERSNVDMILAQGTLLVPTNVPTNGVCEAGGYSYLNFLNYKTGSYVPGADKAAVFTGNDLTTGLNVVWIQGRPVVIRTGSGSAPKLVPGVVFNPGGTVGVTGHRVSWRELIIK